MKDRFKVQGARYKGRGRIIPLNLGPVINHGAKKDRNMSYQL
jgi:hypothetical protein